MTHADLSTLLVLGTLAFILVTLVLYTLAHQLHAEIGRHDLIREARMQRQAYLHSLAARRRGANADYGSVDIEADKFDVDVIEEPSPLSLSADAAEATSAPRLAA